MVLTLAGREGGVHARTEVVPPIASASRRRCSNPAKLGERLGDGTFSAVTIMLLYDNGCKGCFLSTRWRHVAMVFMVVLRIAHRRLFGETTLLHFFTGVHRCTYLGSHMTRITGAVSRVTFI